QHNRGRRLRRRRELIRRLLRAEPGPKLPRSRQAALVKEVGIAASYRRADDRGELIPERMAAPLPHGGVLAFTLGVFCMLPVFEYGFAGQIYPGVAVDCFVNRQAVELKADRKLNVDKAL